MVGSCNRKLTVQTAASTLETYQNENEDLYAHKNLHANRDGSFIEKSPQIRNNPKPP